MKIAKVLKNDTVNGIGVCVSLFVQGCPHHCFNCFNPETWDFNGGYESNDLTGDIVKALTANNIKRNLSILGGEPLCSENKETIALFIKKIKIALPEIKIFLWTGYELSELKEQRKNDEDIDFILNNINYLIDGKFIQEEKDLNLWLRGSRNQNVYKLTEEKKYVKIEKINGMEKIINE